MPLAKTTALKIAVKPLTPERWPDLESVFRSKGCSQARSCWCMYYRRTGAAPAPPPGVSAGEANRRAFKAAVDGGAFTGLVAYRGKVPVGWVSFGPREDFLKLEHSPVMKAVDETPVWSIVCFVVPAGMRGQGVASALLAGAVAYAKKHKVRLEAYPVDKAGRAGDDTLWFGTKSMYDAAGFVEVARRKPTRPIVRLAVAAPSRGRTRRPAD